MHFCGICHSDVHIGLNHLSDAMYPVVPGHELIGIVTEDELDDAEEKLDGEDLDDSDEEEEGSNNNSKSNDTEEEDI